MQNIVIGILMPVFNEEKFICEAVESILKFSYPENYKIKIFITDDFSTDSTWDILTNLAERYPNTITAIKNTQKGKNNAFNTAFSKNVECDYICLMGGDDKIIPEALIERAQIIENSRKKHKKEAEYASACKILTFSDENKYDGILIPREKGQGAISGGSLMFTTSLAKKIFPLPIDYPNEDTWISLFLRYQDVEIIHLDKIGLLYRIHANNSHKRGVSFSKYKMAMWHRSQAALDFYITHKKNISTEKERQLITEIAIECLKFLGAKWSILLLPKTTLTSKAKHLTYTTNFFYTLKQIFYKRITGR